jgi:hypothetical protein
MLSIHLILAAVAILALSGFPACLLPSRSVIGQRVSVALMILGSLLGLGGIAASIGLPSQPELHLPTLLPGANSP